MLKKIELWFMEIREVVFESCWVNGRNLEIMDVLEYLENIFIFLISNGYLLIYDLLYEVLVYYYGNKN